MKLLQISQTPFDNSVQLNWAAADRLRATLEGTQSLPFESPINEMRDPFGAPIFIAGRKPDFLATRRRAPYVAAIKAIFDLGTGAASVAETQAAAERLMGNLEALVPMKYVNGAADLIISRTEREVTRKNVLHRNAEEKARYDRFIAGQLPNAVAGLRKILAEGGCVDDIGTEIGVIGAAIIPGGESLLRYSAGGRVEDETCDVDDLVAFPRDGALSMIAALFERCGVPFSQSGYRALSQERRAELARDKSFDPMALPDVAGNPAANANYFLDALEVAEDAARMNLPVAPPAPSSVAPAEVGRYVFGTMRSAAAVKSVSLGKWTDAALAKVPGYAGSRAV